MCTPITYEVDFIVEERLIHRTAKSQTLLKSST